MTPDLWTMLIFGAIGGFVLGVLASMFLDYRARKRKRGWGVPPPKPKRPPGMPGDDGPKPKCPPTKPPPAANRYESGPSEGLTPSDREALRRLHARTSREPPMSHEGDFKAPPKPRRPR